MYKSIAATNVMSLPNIDLLINIRCYANLFLFIKICLE